MSIYEGKFLITPTGKVMRAWYNFEYLRNCGFVPENPFTVPL
ncbi:hypothetical protein ABOONEI_2654 [Aciduliprofundum boonei T469]|nr:hypothetical protein ABOONEI_2654 [Aciduliprofundum boonei T469]